MPHIFDLQAICIRPRQIHRHRCSVHLASQGKKSRQDDLLHIALLLDRRRCQSSTQRTGPVYSSANDETIICTTGWMASVRLMTSHLASAYQDALRRPLFGPCIFAASTMGRYQRSANSQSGSHDSLISGLIQVCGLLLQAPALGRFLPHSHNVGHASREIRLLQHHAPLLLLTHLANDDCTTSPWTENYCSVTPTTAIGRF